MGAGPAPSGSGLSPALVIAATAPPPPPGGGTKPLVAELTEDAQVCPGGGAAGTGNSIDKVSEAQRKQKIGISVSTVLRSWAML